MNLNQITINVSNAEISVKFYKKLGLKLIVLETHQARFICPNGDTTFSLHLSEEKINPSGTVIYFECENLDKTVNDLKSQGLSFETESSVDQPWLWCEIYLRDPDGYRLCLFHAGENRKNPPWRIDVGANE